MTTAAEDRQDLAQFAEHLGWERKAYERVDVYIRRPVQIHTIWRGNVLNGSAHYDDSMLMAYSKDLAKVHSWLAK
ncbi:MAG TPA: hypothetical protein VF299_05925 [Mycobacterium sp.]